MALDFSLPDAGPVIGLGVDIVDIARIRDVRERQGERFLHRVYTQVELDYCLGMSNPDPHLAVRFAAKEAVSKAFSTGIGEHFEWKSIGVVPGERRQPEIELDAKGMETLKAVGGVRVAISLSHAETTAIAIAAVIGSV